jgi:hypothetical protein
MLNSIPAKSQWFSSAEAPIQDIVQMLVQAGTQGAITADMRQAMWTHATNQQDTLLLSINAMLNLMASATISPMGTDPNEMANALYGVRSLVEQLQAMNELAVVAEPATWKQKQHG